ncbi:MAG: methyltransferase domain-containing protein [Phycisphaerales bacterium]|nr:methyltransferase domain-containing protein [Phycisphaerales bacterium]
MIYLPRNVRLSAADELTRYRLHRNDVHDPGYLRFLAPLADVVLRATTAAARGLDFGCGPGAAFGRMLEDAGRTVRSYDPLFAPDEQVWARTYDFIVASEVFEHLYHPRDELNRRFGVLRPGGVLGVMTSFVPVCG